MHQLSTAHKSTLKHVLQYLKRILNDGFLLHKQLSFHLHAFIDANWIDNTVNRISMLAYIVFLEANMINCSFKK